MNLDRKENSKSGIGIFVWAALHVALCVAVVMAYPWRIDQSLYSIVPDSETTKEIQEADAKLSARTASHIALFVGDSNFSVAANAASGLGEWLENSGRVKSADWRIPEVSVKGISEFAFENRRYLQDAELLEKDDSTVAGLLFDKAISRVYGAFPLSDLSHLEEDPYLLSANAEEKLLSLLASVSGRLSAKDGFLTVADSGRVYVLIQAELADSVSSFASEGHVLADLDAKIDSLKKEHPGLQIEKSGVPFHSYSSSKEAKWEVAWISGVSVVFVLLLLLAAFRSTVPIWATLASIFIAILSAVGATLAVFREIHIFTFVFGASIIGVSIDYALHRFAEREFPLKGVLLGFATTELSYIALTIVDFPVLRQMAFFSMVGLLSALLSVLLVFPKISARFEICAHYPSGIMQAILSAYSKAERIPRIARYVIYVFAAAALIPGFSKLQIQTDLKALYKPTAELAASEAKAAKWMRSGFSPSYFIVAGSSEEQVLEREESLAKKLREAQKDSLFKGLLAVSEIRHSQKYREEMDSLLSKALPIRQEELCRLLKVKCPKSDDLGLEGTRLAKGEDSLSMAQRLWRSLWIGKIGDSHYSSVVPLYASEAFDVRQFADAENGIFAVNKMQEVNAALTELSLTELSLVAFAYFAMFFVLSFVYTWRDSLRIVRAPILSCLFTLSVFGYAGIPVNFFAITGLILVLGIGIDYALFFKDSRNHADETAFVVLLSALTTLASFGTLALSHFVPVSVFGLSVLLGISACFLLSPFTRDS